MTVTAPWEEAQMASNDIPKKTIVAFLHAVASNEFLAAKKLNKKVPEIVKSTKREDLIAHYKALFESQSFRPAGEVPIVEVDPAAKALGTSKGAKATTTAATPKEQSKYRKQLLVKGDKVNFPKKGDAVSCWYTGQLEDGTVFDTNMPKGKKKGSPLKFKVGVGKVIRGWDEALLTMSKGEQAKLTIEPEWAYGAKGMAAAGIPPNATLIFEVELAGIA
ncbi:FK506-binding protein 2B [Tieghemiomyces parasiticus]|uniref:peptidylprolyl isomerase n=1 Tax=Tieghemiomyces parasiticus TaxID=78921 RepID=A0A9W7ZSX0_9FUNG|nr:FK506-binding protein 2B [Tieghemiomyces parasiticus]